MQLFLPPLQRHSFFHSPRRLACPSLKGLQRQFAVSGCGLCLLLVLVFKRVIPFHVAVSSYSIILQFVDSQGCRMPVDIPWPHPEGSQKVGRLRTSLWRWTSSVTVFAVGGLSKLWMQGLNTSFVHDEKTLLSLIEQRESGRPLLTVCNHTSTAGGYGFS